MRPLEQASYQNRGERTLHAAEIHPWDTFFKAGFRRQAALAVEVDGKQWDIFRPIEHDAKLRIITRKDAEALELIRHDCAHVMAEAVQELFPGTQVTIGPVIENGFFYDFAKAEPFVPEDIPKIEKRMAASPASAAIRCMGYVDDGDVPVLLRTAAVVAYPSVDEVIPLMAEGLILPYLDVPLQHAHPEVLKRMKRPANGEKNIERIRAWRAACP